MGPTGRTEFERLFRTHFRAVCNRLRTMGVREADIDDAAQEVFVVLHRRLDSLPDKEGVRHWLAAVATRVAYGFTRKTRNRHELHDDAPDTREASDSLADEAMAAREDHEQLLALLDGLDADKRLVFVMHDVEDLTAREVADMLGIPLNTVYSRLRLARGELARAVKRHLARQTMGD